MKRISTEVTQYNDHGSNGMNHEHNFKNRYLADNELMKPSQQQEQELYKYSKQKLNDLANIRTENSQRSFADKNNQIHEATFIKYLPKNNQQDNNSGAKARIIKMQQVQVDPLAPPQFRHKRIAQPQRSPPPQVMHSPPRKITVKDQQDWKIPPCISNWKNPYGYTIALDMRLSADGRNLQTVTINDKFSQFTNAMYLAEKQARKEIEERINIQKSQRYKEYLKQEEEMREAAIKAREEKRRLMESGTEENKSIINTQEELSKQDRDDIRQLRKREIERERRLEQMKKGNMERDISEKIALGQAQSDNRNSNELLYDQRLFNQTQGLGHGYTHDDDYNVYDKPLFQDKSQLIQQQTQLIREQDQQENDHENRKRNRRNAPLEFERQTHNNNQNEDQFRMDEFVDQKHKKIKQQY